MSSFTHEISSPHLHGPDRGRLGRPSFSSQITSDRLRDSERRSASAVPTTKIKPQRRSVFREEGLDDLDHSVHHKQEPIPSADTDNRKYGHITFDAILRGQEQKENVGDTKKQEASPWFSRIAKPSRPTIKSAASAPPGSLYTLPRSALIVFLIALVVPGFRYSTGTEQSNISGADAGVIRTSALVDNGSTLEGRQNSPTSVCTRWSHQSTNRSLSSL
jgi:hypothetical protein